MSVNLAELQDSGFQPNHLAHRVRRRRSRIQTIESGPRADGRFTGETPTHVGLRKRVYPGQIAKGTLTHKKAARQIDIMRAIAHDYWRLANGVTDIVELVRNPETREPMAPFMAVDGTKPTITNSCLSTHLALSQ